MLPFLVFSLAAALPPPVVVGPRRTTEIAPTYRFVVRGVPKPRFRCSVDSPRLRACPARYRPTMRIGRHVLRVQALDRRGRKSRVTKVQVVIVDPNAPLIQQVRVDGQPFSLVASNGSIWVANFGAGSVQRIDPATNRVTARIDVGGEPYGIAAGAGSIWVGNNGSDSVTRVDAATNAIVARIHIGDRPIGIGFVDGAAWAADFGDGVVARIDPATNSVVAKRVIPGEHEDVAGGFGSIWVPNEEGTVTRVDPASLAPQATIRVGLDPDFVVIEGGTIWTTAYQDSVISRIDPGTNAVVGTLAVPSGLQGLAFDRGSAWAANYNDDTLLRLDPSTGDVLGRWKTANQPRDVLAAAGSIWVAGSRGGAVTRLTLRAR